MYGERISHWAKRNPGNIAVVLPRAAIDYAAFDGHINKVAARLGALAITPGSRVAVHVADVYLHWLLVLALDRLGIASASLDALVEEKYIRAVPVDPMTKSRDTWQTILADPEPGNPSAEPGIYNVKSGAEGTGLDGTPYTEW